MLSAELGKPVHIHVDQQNHDRETASESVIRILKDLDIRGSGEPLVWLVHSISPSTYDEARFERLLDGMRETNVGIICCPSAALSMRQYRPLLTPTHNSIARVLEMLAARIPVRIGSDNICDITSPAGTLDLLDEMFVLTNAVRYYDLDIMSKIAAGSALDESDCVKIKAHLDADAAEVRRALDRFDAGMI